jgi:hypothetical protein
MTLQLHPDWKAIVARSWAMRFILVAALGGFGEGIVQTVTSGMSFSAGFALLIGCVNAAAAVSRVIVQNGLTTTVSNARSGQ